LPEITLQTAGGSDYKTIGKTTYFSPTNENTLYISFKPTVGAGEGIIQVEKVTVDYYEFVTDSHSYVSTTSDAFGYVTYDYYKTLKKVWETY
jgi:hypothetical protein